MLHSRITDLSVTVTGSKILVIPGHVRLTRFQTNNNEAKRDASSQLKRVAGRPESNRDNVYTLKHSVSISVPILHAKLIYSKERSLETCV